MRRIGSVGFSLSLLLVLPATSRAQSALEAVSSGFSWWLLESPSPGGFQSISAIVPPLACGGDCDEAAFWIGFGPPPGDTFFYGGVEYDTILMTSNGYAIAGSTADPGFLTPVNQAMPDSTVPNNVLAPSIPSRSGSS